MLKRFIKRIVNLFFKLFKVKKNRIMFQCGRGMIDGSPKAIYDYMKKNNPEYQLIWVVNKNVDTSSISDSNYAKEKTLKALYIQATSKYWIRSESIGGILAKKKNQIYIQAWHGHGALKKMGYDVTGEVAKEPVDHVRDWDYLITNDLVEDKIMVSSTGYNKKRLMIGTPLLDSIIKKATDEQFKNKLKEKLNIKNNKKIILYAPTFRDEDLDLNQVNLKISSLSKLDDYNILIRLHPLMRNKINKDIYKNKNFIDCCSYPDSSELLCIADILISDYSSIIYEYSLLNKPIIFYAYDMEEYMKTRGFYLEFPSEMPGKTVYDEESLYETIKNIDLEKNYFLTKLYEFNKKYNYLNDGNVCKKFVECLKKM